MTHSEGVVSVWILGFSNKSPRNTTRFTGTPTYGAEIPMSPLDKSRIWATSFINFALSSMRLYLDSWRHHDFDPFTGLDNTSGLHASGKIQSELVSLNTCISGM